MMRFQYLNSFRKFIIKKNEKRSEYFKIIFGIRNSKHRSDLNIEIEKTEEKENDDITAQRRETVKEI